jgi:ATP-binding cassette, subfamily B, bacterial
MEARRYSTLALYRRLFELARPYRLHIAGVMLLSLLSTPLALLTPLPLKIVVDSVVGGLHLPTWVSRLMPFGATPGGALATAIGLLLGVALLTELQGLATWVLQTYTTEQLLLRFRAQLFGHVQRLSMTYHDTRGTSDSTYRIQYDAQAVQNLAVNGLVPFVTASLTLVAMVVVIASLDWLLAIVALAVTPLLFWLAWASSGRIREQWADIKQSDSSSMAVVHEVLGALRVVRAFGQEQREENRFVLHSARAMSGQIRLARTQGSFDLAVGMTTAIGVAATLYVGTIHLQAGALSVGELLLVLAYMAQLFAPIQTITKRIGVLQGSIAGAERAFALLDEVPEVVDRPNARPIARSAGVVRFEHVSFEYAADQPVLRDVSFEVPAGARVGIAGPTGAGKTTLVNLVTRMYDPTGGAILLDGVDLRDYRLTDLRGQFGIVLQEPVLFSTTLAENIAYAKPDATLDEIMAAAKAASAHDFISALPDGYDTMVGERGFRLSGGERQRVSLARAFLKDAPILIFDEPTSSVDVGTEGLIMQAMDRLMAGRTTFIIAHRLNTLERCDVRLVLEHGRLRPASRASEVAVH